MDTGSVGHDHVKAKFPYRCLRIICSEEMADSPRANKNFRARKEGEKKLMNGAPRSPMVSGWEAQEELPNEKSKKWSKNYYHSQLLYKPWGRGFQERAYDH